jgi:L-aspartate oxidase
MAAKLDPRTALIPVAPAAHYHMGGVATDAWGRATLDGLSAVGECASSGAHGANRLASNSLLESVVFAHRIADRLRESESASDTHTQPTTIPPMLPQEARAELRGLMQTHAGVVREGAGLSHALDRVDMLANQHGAANALVAARLILSAALAREESRGSHFRSDYPDAGEQKRTFVTRGDALPAAFAGRGA